MSSQEPQRGVSPLEADVMAQARAQGIAWTRQRTIVLRAFLGLAGHPTVDDVYEASRAAHARTSKSTVYRSLNVLIRLGIVERVDLGANPPRYQRRTNDRRPHHYHLIDNDSGGIVDINSPIIDHVVADAASRLGYRVEYVTLVVHACRLPEKTD